MGTPSSFSAMFSNGDNFTSCLLDCKTKSSQMGSTPKGRKLLQWEQISFLYGMTSIYMWGVGGGGNNENNGVASPENVPFTLRCKDTCPYFSALFSNEKKSKDLNLISLLEESLLKRGLFYNPIALRQAKVIYNYGLSECNRVKETKLFPIRVDSI